MQRFPTAFLSIIACAAIAGCTDKTNILFSHVVGSSLRRCSAHREATSSRAKTKNLTQRTRWL